MMRRQTTGWVIESFPALRSSSNGWEGVLTSFVHPFKTGDFAAHITRNWGRRESLFERLFDLVSYQVI